MKRDRNQAGFPGEGKWYKGNTHCHTTVSDGSLSPQDVADLYRKNGYDFLAVSDHDIYTDFRSQLNRDDFIILPAVEATAVLFEDRNRDRNRRLAIHHIHGILGTEQMRQSAQDGLYHHMEKIPPMEFFGEWDGRKAAEKLNAVLRAHGCFTVYNHPVWSRVDEKDFADLPGLTALEIFNYGSENESATGYDPVHWDCMLRHGIHINAIASDDNHNDGIVEDAFGGFICVKAERLDHESIVSALLGGNYYSSSGPAIYDWGIEDGRVYVTGSEVREIRMIAGNYINDGAVARSEGPDAVITHAEFRLRGNESYVRVECVDRFGRRAWSNPLYLED